VVARGEAAREAVSDEAYGSRHETRSTGSVLLEAALTRENLQQALKRVRANKGAPGVDGLDINQTARHLVTAWPAMREQLLRGTMAPQFVKPYVKTNKNDVADAEAICEAVARPNMRFVPVKNVDQQAVLALHRARQGFVRARYCAG
jgi:hypothetical protein